MNKLQTFVEFYKKNPKKKLITIALFSALLFGCEQTTQEKISDKIPSFIEKSADHEQDFYNGIYIIKNHPVKINGYDIYASNNYPNGDHFDIVLKKNGKTVKIHFMNWGNKNYSFRDLLSKSSEQEVKDAIDIISEIGKNN